MKMEILSKIFSNCLSYVVFLFFFSFLTENNYQQVSLKVNATQILFLFFSVQATLSVWEYHFYVSVSICVCDLLLRVFWWSIHKISSSGAYQSDSLPPHLMIKKKNHSFGIGQYVYPQPSQAATFGIWALVRKFETLLIPIRIRNVPAQIIHINN